MQSTKVCPFCAETIQVAAIVCRFCNRELDGGNLHKNVSPTAAVQDTEVVYLQNQDVTITNTRAVLNGKTYAMANVTSVSLRTLPADNNGATAVGLVGALGGGVIFFVCLQFGETLYALLSLALAVFFVAGSFWLAKQHREKYIVLLGSASGEADALWAYDKAYIEKIVGAISDAITKRG